MTFQFRHVGNICNQDAVQCETMVSYACSHSVGCLEPITQFKWRWSTNRSSMFKALHHVWTFQCHTGLIDPQYFNCDSAHQCFGGSITVVLSSVCVSEVSRFGKIHENIVQQTCEKLRSQEQHFYQVNMAL